jgi:hypothetical protein
VDGVSENGDVEQCFPRGSAHVETDVRMCSKDLIHLLDEHTAITSWGKTRFTALRRLQVARGEYCPAILGMSAFRRLLDDFMSSKSGSFGGGLRSGSTIIAEARILL